MASTQSKLFNEGNEELFALSNESGLVVGLAYMHSSGMFKRVTGVWVAVAPGDLTFELMTPNIVLRQTADLLVEMFDQNALYLDDIATYVRSVEQETIPLDAEFIYDGRLWAVVQEHTIISEDGVVLTKGFVREQHDYADFEAIVDTVDSSMKIEVDASAFEHAERISEQVQRAIQRYEENPPKTFEEDLNYDWNDAETSELLNLIENGVFDNPTEPEQHGPESDGNPEEPEQS